MSELVVAMCGLCGRQAEVVVSFASVACFWHSGKHQKTHMMRCAIEEQTPGADSTHSTVRSTQSYELTQARCF